MSVVDVQRDYTDRGSDTHLTCLLVLFVYNSYSKHVSNIPMFRNLGNSVISAICSMVHPIYVLRGQEVITEGSPGNEFYMLMAGELEVLKVGAVLFCTRSTSLQNSHTPAVKRSVYQLPYVTYVSLAVHCEPALWPSG